jgi:hypothetical protein
MRTGSGRTARTSRERIEKKPKRPPQDSRDAALALDQDTVLAIVAKLVDALSRAVPTSRDLELKNEALRLGRKLLRGTKYQEER